MCSYFKVEDEGRIWFRSSRFSGLKLRFSNVVGTQIESRDIKGGSHERVTREMFDMVIIWLNTIETWSEWICDKRAWD